MATIVPRDMEHDRPRSTLSRNSLLLSASLRPLVRGSATAAIAMRQVSVRVSLPPQRGFIHVANESTLLLMMISDCRDGAGLTILKPFREEAPALLQKGGEVLTLSRGSYEVCSSHARGEVVCLEVRNAGFASLCQTLDLGDLRSFCIPRVAQDPTLHVLSRTVRSVLSATTAVPASFGEYFTLSLLTHLATRFGVQGSNDRPASGGLSPRNRRLVEARLASSGLDISAESLAAECKVSLRHFARAFLQSFGVPFHRFRSDLRVLRTKQLLTETELPLLEIARQMGYADQPTFTEGFKREVGLPPGRYRRQYSLRAVGDAGQRQRADG